MGSEPHSPFGAGADVGLEGEAAGAARYLARERQKAELRDERDRLVLDLARDLGREGLAQRFGVAPSAIDKLLAGARNRLDVKVAASQGSEIAAGRLTPRSDRWADADRHFAQLGSGLAGAGAAAAARPSAGT